MHVNYAALPDDELLQYVHKDQAAYDTMLMRDMADLADDPLEWVKYAYPWGQGELVGFDGPDTWQAEFLAEWGREIRKRGFNGVDPVMPVAFTTTSGHGIGKAHSLDTVIDTPAGQRRWGDLSVGDYVFGSDGLPTRIAATRPYQSIPMYRVMFDDGSSTEVSGGHLWNVRGRQERRRGLHTWRTMSTEDILAAGVMRANGIARAKQWEIPQQGAAQYEAQDIGIDPYVLGLWLGDGGRNNASITSNDLCVVERIEERGYTTTLGSKQGTTAKTIRIHGLGAQLRALGVFDKYSYEKSIPRAAKENSADFRAEVLRGLLDTDGECGRDNGTVQFASTSKQLADDVVWLARSLGGKARIAPTVKKPFYYGKDGSKIPGRDCYRVTITMPHGFRAFYIERKQERVTKVENRYLSRWISSIERIEDQDAMCISVEAEDGLYQANDFIVTHNSTLVAWIAGFILSTRPDSKGRVTANTMPQLETTTWPEITKWSRMMITAHWFKNTSGRGAMKIVHKENPENWRLNGMAWDASRPAAFAGLHAATSTPYYIFDEASEVARIILETAQGGLTDGEPFFFMFSNPTASDGFFFDSHHSMRHRYIARQIDSRTTKMANKQLIAQWIEDRGLDSDYVKVRVLGEFPLTGERSFIEGPLIEAAMSPDREPYATPTDPIIFGVDVARFGGDESTIYIRRGRDMRTIEPHIFHGLPLDQLAHEVRKLANEWLPDAINVDGGGVGGGIVDMLRGWGVPNVNEVQFGGRSPDSEYANMATFMLGELRKWLKMANTCLPVDPILKRQLATREYKVIEGPKGTVVKVESKEELRAHADRGENDNGSPDRADGVALCFAVPVAARNVEMTRAQMSGEGWSNVVGVDYSR